MLINELLQWAVLLFLCVVSLGLLRQLGYYIGIDRRRSYGGPLIGSQLPGDILSAAEARTLQTELSNRLSPRLINLFVVGSDAEYGGLLVAELERTRAATSRAALIPTAAIVPKDEGGNLEGSWLRAADMVIVDEGDSRTARVGSAHLPMLIVVDEHLSVRYVVSGADLLRTASDWLTAPHGTYGTQEHAESVASDGAGDWSDDSFITTPDGGNHS